ncbi:hypothetical protein EMIT0P253_290042 [Pseudomonas sp. IT-P253]
MKPNRGCSLASPQMQVILWYSKLLTRLIRSLYVYLIRHFDEQAPVPPSLKPRNHWA